MPRTKVSKSSKRNRETTNREEKIREFENSFDGYKNSIEERCKEYLASFQCEVNMLLDGTSQALLKMKMVDVFYLDLNHLSDWEQLKSNMLNSQNSSLLLKSARAINPNDEGYLTEDSSTGGSIGSTIANPAYLSASNNLPQVLMQKNSATLRTPGPLSSARARRPRRSCSASEKLISLPGSTLKHTTSQITVIGSEHNSRSKIRTPMSSRHKALSVGRTPKADNANSPQSPLFLRFPKPGELVLSKCGSPLVGQMLPENFAHLNIPLRNGVISMRPKILGEVQPEIVEDLDPAIVDQLRTLKTNIDKIVNMVDKSGF